GAAKERELVRTAPAAGLDPQDHFLVGHEYYSLGELELATQEFRQAFQINAGHFWTNYFLGMCYVTSGEPKIAVPHLAICQGQRPKMIWIYLLRGFALGKMEDCAAAEKDFKLALDLEPPDTARYVLYNNRGVVRVGQKETRSKGVEDLKEAAALRPD